MCRCFMCFTQACCGIRPDLARHGFMAVVGCVQQIEAVQVQFRGHILDAAIQRAPQAGFVYALGAEWFFQHTELEHDAPAAGLPDDRCAPNGGGFNQPFGHGGVYGMCVHEVLAEVGAKSINRMVTIFYRICNYFL